MLKKIIKYKYILFVVAFLLIVTGVYGFTSLNKPNEIEYKTATSTKGNVSVSLSADGKSVIDKRELTFEVGGIVRGVNVAEGQKITAWKTLAYLDTRDAQKNLENEMRNYLIQRNDFEEMKQVTYPEDSVISDSVKRILEKNQWNLEKAVADYELKDLVVKKSYLSSPIAGTVVDINVKPGELAATNKVAFTIVKPDRMVFESYVEDIDALKIKPEMPVRITFDALPDDVVTGKVVFVSPVATIDENDLSMYKVLIEFDDAELTLLDGMAGEVEIISKEVTDVIKIPNSTVKREDGQSIVYLKTNDSMERKIVTLGFTNGKDVEVKEGLTAGEILIDWK
jgi:RND family efflux transporter MFP subunit